MSWEVRQAWSSLHPQRPMYLTNLDYRQRQDYYKRKFCLVERLEDLSTPHLCKEYPDLAEEIFEAYLYHTTFTVRIWTNYDAACKKFFTAEDRRWQDCGKLLLSPTAMHELNELDEVDGLFLRNVRLEISTPFRTFLDFTLSLVDLQDQTFGLAIQQHVVEKKLKDHENLFSHIWGYALDLERNYFSNTSKGISLTSLRNIAAGFVRSPTFDERQAARHMTAVLRGASSCSTWGPSPALEHAIDDTPFMDLNTGNEGWVDVEARREQADSLFMD